MAKQLVVTDLVYQGGGFIVTFNDNSVATALYQFKNDGNKPGLIGLNPQQEEAVAKYNHDLIPSLGHASDIRLHHYKHDGTHYAEDDTETTNSTGVFQTKVQLDVDIPEHSVDPYEISWSAECKKDGGNAGGEMEARMRGDGVVFGHVFQAANPVAVTVNWSSFAGNKRMTLEIGHHVFIMDFKTADGIARMRHARIFAKRIQ